MRKAQLYYYYKDRQDNSLSYEMYDIYSGGTADIADIPASAGQYYIKFTATSGFYYHLSFADVYEGNIPPQYFKDKLVLIGVYGADGLAKDMFFTAIDSHHETYGVEIHANLLQQFIEGNYIQDSPVLLDAGIFALFSLAAAFLFVRFKPRPGLAMLLVLLAGYAGVIYLTVSMKYVVQMIYAPAFCLLAYVAALVWHYIQTKMNEARIRSTFGKYMAPAVVKKILDEGEEGLKLGGQRRAVTVLFVDIRGFTPLSEAAQPEEIVQILNEYLDLVASCIHRYGGTLDKFIGDAAMAIWGAPYDMPGHALAAVNAAKAMRSESAVLEQKLADRYGKSVRFGIGINSGDAIIGNIGASFRMDYTAIGDTVNTAARLESNAKPGQILLSQAAADNLVGEDGESEKINLNFLGGLKVKGREEEVQIYEVAEEI
jgi:adenylate cyclase